MTIRRPARATLSEKVTSRPQQRSSTTRYSPILCVSLALPCLRWHPASTYRPPLPKQIDRPDSERIVNVDLRTTARLNSLERRKSKIRPDHPPLLPPLALPLLSRSWVLSHWSRMLSSHHHHSEARGISPWLASYLHVSVMEEWKRKLDAYSCEQRLLILES